MSTFAVLCDTNRAKGDLACSERLHHGFVPLTEEKGCETEKKKRRRRKEREEKRRERYALQ